MINKALLTEQLKRFWMVSALGCLVYFLLVFVLIYGTANEFAQTRQLVDILAMQNPLPGMIAVVLAVAAAASVFSMLFSRKVSTVFYSFPLNRRQLLSTNALAGIILCLVPVLFVSLLLLIPVPHAASMPWSVPEGIGIPTQVHWPSFAFPSGLYATETINTFPVVALFFLRLVILTLFYFGLCWLAFSLAGNVIIGLLTVVFANILPTGLTFLMGAIGHQYIFGIDFANLTQVVRYVLALSNALAWPFVFEGANWIWPYLYYSGLALVFFGGAFCISRIRKTERTGNSIMFSPVKNVLIFLVSTSFMVVIGSIVWEFTRTPVGLHVGFVLGFALGFVIAQMIAEKSFLIGRKLKYLLHFGGTAVVMYAMMLFVTQVGLSPIVNRVPAREEVVGVLVDRWGRWRTAGDEDIFVRNPQVIDMTIAAHRGVLDNRGALDVAAWRRAMPHNRYQRYFDRGIMPPRNIVFTYLLANGRELTRTYALSESFMTQFSIDAILSHRDMILSRHTIFNHPELVMGIEFRYMPEGTWDDDYWMRGHWGMDVIRVHDPAHIAILMNWFADAVVYQEQQIFRLTERDPHIRPASVDAWLIVDWNRAPRGIHGTTGIHFTGEQLEQARQLLQDFGFPDFSAEE